MSSSSEDEAIAEGSGLLHCVLGPGGQLRWRNPAASRLGSSARHAPRTLADLFHPDDRTKIMVLLEDAREKGRAVATVRVGDPGSGAQRHFQVIVMSAAQSVTAAGDVPGMPLSGGDIDWKAASGDPRGYVAQAWDVTYFVRRQQELEAHAFRDGLTGVANRRSFLTRLDQDLSDCRRASQPIAVLFADIDHFTEINDRHGHGGGDFVLVTLAARLSAMVRAPDTLGRIGGDEFAVICPNLSGWETACAIMDRLRAAAAVPIPTAGGPVTISVSTGAAFAEETHAGPDGATCLLAMADLRMFRAKFADRQPREW